MGTTVYRATRVQAVQDELRDIGLRSLVLAHQLRGTRLWVLAQVREGPKAGSRWIGLTLIRSQGQDVAVKRLDETCGPYYYDCPLHYLAMASAPEGPHAAAWREKVKAYHAGLAEARRRRQQIQPGTRVRYGSAVYRLQRSLGRKGWEVVREPDGLPMRMTARQLGQATRLEAAPVPASTTHSTEGT